MLASVLELEPGLSWFQRGASKELVCFSTRAKPDNHHYSRVRRDHVTLSVGVALGWGLLTLLPTVDINLLSNRSSYPLSSVPVSWTHIV